MSVAEADVSSGSTYQRINRSTDQQISGRDNSTAPAVVWLFPLGFRLE